MRKMSKSDDPQAVPDMPLERASDHFTIGSSVKMNGRAPAEIIDAGDNWIDVRHLDETVERLYPIAFNQEGNHVTS